MPQTLECDLEHLYNFLMFHWVYLQLDACHQGQVIIHSASGAYSQQVLQ